MRVFVVNAVKDLARMRRDPAAFALSLALPLVIGFLLKLISGGDGGTPTAHLLIADQDDSFVSGLLAGGFSQGPLAEIVKSESVTEEAGRKLMSKGKASGLLIIPKDFGDDVLDRTPTALTLITNPSQTILPGILESSTALFVDAVAGLQQVLSKPFESVSYELPEGTYTYPDSSITSISLTVNRLMDRAGPLLFPPVIQVKEVVLEEDEQEADFGVMFFPGMFFMALMFMGQNLSDDLWKEKAQGTLRRIATTPQTRATFLSGKLAAQVVAIAVVAVLGLAAGRWLFRLPLQNLPIAFFWTVLSGLVMLLIFTLFQILAGSQRGGNLLTTVLVFPLIMLGGSFFPFEAMPDWMAAIGRLTPNGYALTQLKQLLVGSANASELLISALVMLGFCAVIFTVTLLRLRSFARTA